MSCNKSLFLVLFITLFNYMSCSPMETNCTRVKSIDGSDGVECERTKQATDPFEPTIIDEHFVDLFTRAKRDAKEDPKEAPVDVVISELFIQNLAVMNQANMSDCMDRVNCEEKCQLIATGVFKEDTDDNTELEGLDQLPPFVRTFYEAGKRGIELGRTAQCGECSKMFQKCDSIQYDYTIKTNNLYKELIEKNITLFEESDSKDQIPAELEYLHHSMRFLDLANLSRCYARVSCESTCIHVKANPNSERPPAKSPLLEKDPLKPASVDIIHAGAILGYTLAFNGECRTCADQYADCQPDRYSIATTSSMIFG